MRRSKGEGDKIKLYHILKSLEFNDLKIKIKEKRNIHLVKYKIMIIKKIR